MNGEELLKRNQLDLYRKLVVEEFETLTSKFFILSTFAVK